LTNHKRRKGKKLLCSRSNFVYVSLPSISR